MPIIIPATVGVEDLLFDGLDLGQGEGGSIRLKSFVPPFAKKRPEWIEAADSDGAILARDPLVSNGQAQITVTIHGVSRDDAQTTIGTIIDKIEEADRTPAGLPLIWIPSGSTPNLTFYVLSGEVTELPIDWESGYMAYSPTVSFTLDCAPYGYGDAVTYTGVATAGPLVTLDLANVPGDAPATGTLQVTEMSSQSRRTVEWGAEYLYYNPASPWSLVLDSDSLVTSGFAGTQTTLAGAYDPNASGNAIVVSTVATSPQAICGTGVQSHVGTFRVKVRINTGAAGCTNTSLRFTWRAGDGSYTTNDPVTVTDATQEFLERDLGLITIPPASTGTQSWDGRVEGWNLAGSDTIYVDYLELIPVEAGYGKATASYSYTPGTIVARDTFTGTTAGVALNARTADAGGTWATSGAATDFTFIDTLVGVAREAITRTTISDASSRFAILGSSSFTDVEVQSAMYRDSPTAIGECGVIARWTDSSNYLRGSLVYTIAFGALVTTLTLTTRVAGVDTTLAAVTLPGSSAVPGAFYTLRMTAFASGRTLLTLLDATGVSLETIDVANATLATGGTLATGKPGILDANTSATACTRVYDDIAVSTPAAEPIALYSGRKLEIRSDSAERESSTGGTWGRPASYRGSRFYVQPAGDGNRTTRVAVKASRNDLATAEDANLSDQIKLIATVTPRYTVIPRP